jgi:formate--tetrahydrofolate ligase
MESGTTLAHRRDLAGVAERLGLGADLVEMHGPHRAKVSLDALASGGAPGRYVLVTAITPTAAGEGKTVTAIGLSMALARAGRRAAVTLRQSSLGPTLGSKGGGAGGGASRIEPLEEALLGLGSDLFAVETANNLLAAMLDEGLRHGLHGIDPGTVTWKRVIDVDDRALRHISVGVNGSVHDTGFEITAASEVMAVLALSRDLADLRGRLGRIVPAFDGQGRPVTAEQLQAAGAMSVLLREALRPNLMQTSEGTPVLIHTGPFGNIATGNSSLVGDLILLPRVDYLVTEAGFGADLGAEKLLDIKAPLLGQTPDAIVLVATVRSLRLHGRPDLALQDLDRENPAAVTAGLPNLRKHLSNLAAYGIPVVVALNRFPHDSAAELAIVREAAREEGAVAVADCDAFEHGGGGALELAEAVIDACRLPKNYRPLLRADEPARDKVDTLATRLYGAREVRWSESAAAGLQRLTDLGFGSLPVCMAKTHLSLSHDPALKGAPAGYVFPIEDVRLAAGAGFLKVFAGPIVTMPGLPSHPRAADMDLAADGSIVGLA